MFSIPSHLSHLPHRGVLKYFRFVCFQSQSAPHLNKNYEPLKNIDYGNVKLVGVFITDLEKIIGRNRLTLRRWWLEDKFPKPVKLNGTTLAWHAKSIHDWINQNIAAKG